MPDVSATQSAPTPVKPARVFEVGSVIDDFEILQEIGRGGMGVVYKARQRRLNRTVALKALNPELAEDFSWRFLREAVLGANLAAQPNIIPVYHVDDSPQPRYFTMEFVEGISVKDKVAPPGGPLPIDEAIRIALEACEALHFAHQRGIIHRDVKPSNILLQREPQRVRIADFGIAQDLTGVLAERTQTEGLMAGTLAFMSPEQNLGVKDLDARTDVFSLGMTLYYMLTGTVAYPAQNRPELAVVFKEHTPTPPSQINRRLDSQIDGVVLRMIEVDREQRYPHCAAAAAALQAVLLDLQRTAASAGRGEIVPAAQAPADELVRLEINANRLYMKGWSCVLDFRLWNLSGTAVSDVFVEAEAKRLTHEEAAVWQPELTTEEPWRDYIQIEPQAAGTHRVGFSVRFLAGGRRHAYLATATLRVLEKPDGPTQIVLDNSIIAGEGAKIGFGFSLHGQNDAGKVSGEVLGRWDVNRLLLEEPPERWQRLRLRESHATGVPAVSGPPKKLDKAALVLQGEQDMQRVLLLGLQEVRMGRHRSLNDVVLRVLPRSPEHDTLSQHIQSTKGPHMVLSLRPEGLVLKDMDTANGTELNGRAVRRQAVVPLDRPSELAVAGVLRMQLVPFLDAGEQDGQVVQRYVALGEPDPLWQLAARWNLRSVLVKRIDNWPQEQYLLVYRWADIGRGADSELQVPQACPARRCMRILRLGGGYWLECLVDSKCLLADGKVLHKNSACGLEDGMKIACGNRTLTFGLFGQPEL